MRSQNKPIKIILADDHEIFRDGFRGMLRLFPRIQLVAEAANGQQLVDLADQHKPQVILTDISMPGIDGVKATRLITGKHPGIGIIAFSSYNNEKLIMDMLEAGAKGYLLKSAEKSEIIEAIITVAQNKPYYCRDTDIKLEQLIHNSRYKHREPLKKIIFTEREKQVIELICRQFLTREISDAMHLSVRTIEGYRERILQKINARTTAGIVVYALRNDIYVP